MAHQSNDPFHYPDYIPKPRDLIREITARNAVRRAEEAQARKLRTTRIIAVTGGSVALVALGLFVKTQLLPAHLPADAAPDPKGHLLDLEAKTKTSASPARQRSPLEYDFPATRPSISPAPQVANQDHGSI